VAHVGEIKHLMEELKGKSDLINWLLEQVE